MQSSTRPDLRRIVRDDCVALYLHHTRSSRMSWHALAKAAGIGNGTAQRIHEMTADASLSTIEAIATHYGLLPWQVLVPDLNPANPPVFLMTATERKLYDDLARSVASVSEIRATYERPKTR